MAGGGVRGVPVLLPYELHGAGCGRQMSFNARLELLADIASVTMIMHANGTSSLGDVFDLHAADLERGL